MATAPPRALPPLAEDLRTDVAVIGAGIAGIMTAYLLALEGGKSWCSRTAPSGAARPAAPLPTSRAPWTTATTSSSPGLGSRFSIGELEYTWSGQVMEPVDGLGYIGRNPGDKGHILVATGDSGHGMTPGTIAGILLTDLVLGRPNPWERQYDPSRRSLKSAAEYLKENMNVAKQYLDYVSPGEVGSVDEIRPGHGAVIRQGLGKLAVYRDRQGALHARSAVCTHLGCIVHWNSLEGTWNCPCHGSRFGTDGRY